MNVLSLFSGIGGIELGLERAGMTVVGQVEIDPYCQQVLAKHWPGVPRHDDVRTAAEWWLGASAASGRLVADSGGPRRRQEPRGAHGDETSDGWGAEHDHIVGGNGESVGDGVPGAGLRTVRPAVDVICGGFPCQDISNAGRREGITGERSGLFFAMADTVRQLRPTYVVMENVSALVNRGLDVVLAEMAACGYDVQWDCVPAAAVGAPHRRDRWWGIAYPAGLRRGQGRAWGSAGSSADGEGVWPETLAHPDAGGWYGGSGVFPEEDWRGQSENGSGDGNVADANRVTPFWPSVSRSECGHWAAEPDVGRVANGIPRRVDRLKGLGNAVVPQVAEHVGRLLMNFHATLVAA